MRAINPTYVSRTPGPRVGPKSIRIPLSFLMADTDELGTFRFDLTQEMMTGQFGTPQTLYFDNTRGVQDVQLYFSATDQYVRFPTRSLSIIPFFGGEAGPIYARYQTENYVVGGANGGFFTDDVDVLPVTGNALYYPVLYLLNTPMPFGTWLKTPLYDATRHFIFGRAAGEVLTGGMASDVILRAIAAQAVPALFDTLIDNRPACRVRIHIYNPVTEVEPLFWAISGSANANNERLMPGESITFGEGTPISQGTLQLAAATAGHRYIVQVWELSTI
jgi:hypothetical protein